jgi:hypothetical protein
MVNFLGCFASGCSTGSSDGRPGPPAIEAVSLPGVPFDPHALRSVVFLILGKLLCVNR